MANKNLTITNQEIKDIKLATGTYLDQLPNHALYRNIRTPDSWDVDSWDLIAKLGFDNTKVVETMQGRYTFPDTKKIKTKPIAGDTSNNAQYSSVDDAVTMGVVLSSSNAVAEHEYRHRGFRLLADMLSEDPEYFRKHYGTGAYNIVDRYRIKNISDPFSDHVKTYGRKGHERDVEMFDNRDEHIMAPTDPKTLRMGQPAVVFPSQKIAYKKFPYSLHGEGDITTQRNFDRYKSLKDNIGQKTLFPRKEQKLFEGYETLERAAQDMIDKRNSDRRKNANFSTDEYPKPLDLPIKSTGYSHGGDVPHADEPYLDGRAENIVKKFNEPNDEFLDTAIELAAEPLQEAKEAFMKAGKGAVFEMLPKDNPKVYQAFRQTNDYLAGLGYAGYKTTEAAAKFVAGAFADALGQDKGEIGEGILRSEASAARDIMAMPEAFAGMVGPKSAQMLDDAVDAFGGYFDLLKAAGPVIKADLSGKLQALADGDFDFLKESPNTKTTSASAQVTGQGTTPVDQPDPKSLTTPKSLVSPLFKTASTSNLTSYPDYVDKNPFYSSLLTALDNLPVGKKGVKGSNVIKYLTKNAPNINMKELYWSGMLENAPMRGTVGYKGSNQDIQGIDPDKTYTKDSLIRMANASVPQIGVRKFTSLFTDYRNQPQWKGMQQVPMNIFTIEPITVGASSTTPARSRVANTRRNANGFTHRIGRGNFEGGQSPNSEYVEYLITNVNSRGSTYPKSDAHWGRKVDGKKETVLAHVRGSFIPIIYPTSTLITKGTVGKGKVERGHTTTNVFVVDEIQADPAQKSPAEVRADKPSTVASQRTSKETAKILNTPEVDVKTAFTTNLTKAIDEMGRPPEFIPTSDRFNRIFGVDENDLFSVQTDKVNQGLKEIVETLLDVEKKFLANDLDRDEVAEVISATFNDSLKTTAILRNTTGPGAFPEAIMNQIKLNVLGDLIYGKGVVKRTPVLKTKLEEVILNSLGGKPIAPTDITPVGTGDSIRLGLLSIMREALKKKTNTIVIPPIDDLMIAHSLGLKPTKETYEDAMMKALRILSSETNKKVTFTKGKIKGLQFDSDKNYLIINFDSDILDGTKQTRFAEGGLV